MKIIFNFKKKYNNNKKNQLKFAHFVINNLIQVKAQPNTMIIFIFIHIINIILEIMADVYIVIIKEN